MTDLMTTVTTAAAGIKATIELVKTVLDTDSQIQEQEQRAKLVDIINNLANVQLELAGLKSELAEKENQNRELQKKLEIRDTVEFETPFYWTKSPEGVKDGPFCQRCYDDTHKLCRVIQSVAEPVAWSCNVCRTTEYTGMPAPPRVNW